jgi:sugar lactone lactonase YvrE
MAIPDDNGAMRYGLKLWICGALLAGCDDAASGVAPSDGAVDAVVDAGRMDAGRADQGVQDAGGPDAGGADAMTDRGMRIDAAIDMDAPDGMPDMGPDQNVDPPERRFAGRYALDAEFTEGGIYDPAGHAFFFGSLSTGGVYRVDANTGEQTTLFEPDGPGVWWTLGMDIDPVDGRLYVCAMDDRRELDEEHDYAGYLWGFDLATGDRVVDRDLRAAADGATCTDVAVGVDGTIFVNDRENPRLYTYRTQSEELTQWVEDDALSGGIVGQNALVALPDGSGVLSLIYLPSRLVHVALPDGRITEVDIDGDFFDGLPALSGADGMTLDDDGSLLVAFTSQLNRVRPTLADWSTAESTTVDVPAGMTDVVHTPGGVYLLNGQAVSFALGRDPEPFALVRFEGDL